MRRRAWAVLLKTSIALLSASAIWAVRDWRTALSTFALSTIAGAAAALAGGFVGFLFGVPRTVAGERYTVNTSLEEISDWLTKMIIAVLLVELPTFPNRVSLVVTAVAGGLGGGAANTAFVGALLLASLVAGFLNGYLLAPIWLRPEVTTARPASVDLINSRIPEQKMPTFNEIAAICQKAPTTFTPQAQMMVYQVLASVTDDPHPAWNTSQLLPADASAALTGQLPSLLAEVGSHSTVRNRSVTTFDVLHWLASFQLGATRINLDRLCPFDK